MLPTWNIKTWITIIIIIRYVLCRYTIHSFQCWQNVDAFLQTFPHRRNVASQSLLYCYFNDNCLNRLHLLVSVLQMFLFRTRYAGYTRLSHSHSIRIKSLRREYDLIRFFPGTDTLKVASLNSAIINTSSLGRGMGSNDIYHTYPQIMRFLLYLFMPSQRLHSVDLYHECLLALVLVEQ